MRKSLSFPPGLSFPSAQSLSFLTLPIGNARCSRNVAACTRVENLMVFHMCGPRRTFFIFDRCFHWSRNSSSAFVPSSAAEMVFQRPLTCMVSRQKSALVLKRDFFSDVKGLYVFGSLSTVELVLFIFSFDLLWGGSVFVMILARGFH